MARWIIVSAVVVIIIAFGFLGGNTVISSKKDKILKSSKQKSEIKRIRLVNLRKAQKAKMVKLREQRSQKGVLTAGLKS